MRRVLLAVLAAAVLPAAGCGDRLGQGDRVILVDPKSDRVVVSGMPDHYSENPARAERQRVFGETGTVDDVPAGTAASVINDPEKDLGPGRPVKVKLLDPPYAGMTGEVRRENLKK